MSSHLKQYLTDYLNWAEADAPPHDAFSPFHPLCGNARFWVRKENRITLGGEIDTEQMVDELQYMFDSDGLDIWYPFGEEKYFFECHSASHHRNPVRIEWVRQTIKSI